MAETSDIKFLNTCRRLLDIFAGEPRWAPSNAELELGNLEAKLVEGYPIAQDVWAKAAPQVIKINQRQETYAKIAPLVRASRRYLKSSGATERRRVRRRVLSRTVVCPDCFRQRIPNLELRRRTARFCISTTTMATPWQELTRTPLRA